MKGNIAVKKEIKSVNLKLCAYDGRSMEIPLEEWQVGIICQMFGLSVELPLNGKYKISSKENIEKRMEVYYNAIRKQNKDKRDH